MDLAAEIQRELTEKYNEHMQREKEYHEENGLQAGPDGHYHNKDLPSHKELHNEDGVTAEDDNLCGLRPYTPECALDM